MKVFLDTNVLVSAFTTRGLCADLFRATLSQQEFFVGKVVLRRVERILRQRFRMPERLVDDITALLRSFPVVDPPAKLPTLSIRDRDDVPVIASAIAAGADYFVTGDKEILALSEKLPLRILSPRQLWEVMRGDE